jgi:hypothetical protein
MGMFTNQSVELKIKGAPVKIHAVSTGSVSVKTKFRERTKNGIFATFDFLLGGTFTEWMPIWVWITIIKNRPVRYIIYEMSVIMKNNSAQAIMQGLIKTNKRP